MVIFYELYVGKEDCEKCCSCMHSPQHSQVTGGGATITQNQCRECDHLCPAGKKMHTGLRFSSTDCDVTLQDSCRESSLRYKCVFRVSLTLCQNMTCGATASSWLCLRWARCCCPERTPSSLSGPWQSSCKRRAWTPEPVRGRKQRERWCSSATMERQGLSR